MFIGDDEDSIPDIPPNDLRHRIGRQTSNQNNGKICVCVEILKPLSNPNVLVHIENSKIFL